MRHVTAAYFELSCIVHHTKADILGILLEGGGLRIKGDVRHCIEQKQPVVTLAPLSSYFLARAPY